MLHHICIDELRCTELEQEKKSSFYSSLSKSLSTVTLKMSRLTLNFACLNFPQLSLNAQVSE